MLIWQRDFHDKKQSLFNPFFLKAWRNVITIIICVTKCARRGLHHSSLVTLTDPPRDSKTALFSPFLWYQSFFSQSPEEMWSQPSLVWLYVLVGVFTILPSLTDPPRAASFTWGSVSVTLLGGRRWGAEKSWMIKQDNHIYTKTILAIAIAKAVNDGHQP